MIKRTLKRSFPNLYQRLFDAKQRLVRQGRTEYKVLREIVRRRGKKADPWNEVLPIQRVRQVSIGDADYESIEQLLADLDQRVLEHADGSSSVYLPPAALTKAPFDAVAKHYPPTVGLKIMKDVGGQNSVSGGRLSRSGELCLIANLLYESGLGPRLYDLVELECGRSSWHALVVDHIDGAAPGDALRDDAAGLISKLERDRTLRVSLPSDSQYQDFHGTTSNGNARADDGGVLRYFSFHNFTLDRYGRYLEKVALDSANDTHFGEESILRRGRFLYQSVPGVNLPAKRSIDERIRVIDELVESAGLSVDGRLVLDVGCNTGMMMAEYLKRGAGWCHGWDTETVAPRTDSLLRALGCTRFSTTGTMIEVDRPLGEDLPEFARPMLNGCVISYLAIRYHLGWALALGQIPWSYMIYEGHQYETISHFEEHVDQLRKIVDVEVPCVTTYEDGFSNERVVGILKNASNSPEW